MGHPVPAAGWKIPQLFKNLNKNHLTKTDKDKNEDEDVVLEEVEEQK